MIRRSAVLFLVAGLLVHATGLTLAAHLHEYHGDHDTDRCPTCQWLVGGTKVLPTPSRPPTLDWPAREFIPRPADPAHIERFDDRPLKPRAPPLA
ncbi:MAG TPA: hypothetical protein VLM89_11525 [Phycisphaerae bacterium]|nr:hypothetical protein [Phycisphaerae bacterium]